VLHAPWAHVGDARRMVCDITSGALLLPAGTHLTERVIDRLADVGEL
jgi:hypothetical protein